MTTTTMTEAAVPAPRRRGLNIGLWAAQGVLAALFLAAGLMKATAPIDQLQAAMPWVKGPMGSMVRFIGGAELLGAIGLIAPAVTRIKPWLTPLAALGLTVVMVLAFLTHLAGGEVGMLPVTIVIGGLAAFVAWGRSRPAPIAARR